MTAASSENGQMLATFLKEDQITIKEDLRQHLLWERKQITHSDAAITKRKRRQAAYDVANLK
ncbi:uncharacterized protein RSE6_02290 [Rhynchosporium secalis]|uniref:DUF3295 domain-containing protein n=1 Tax=Rhynchosporium secalis TaxID=38038 RepID=A0A1E1LZV2_RHYSE|nr:uncharacterized protein RSE6_02290 [Rhynchosporium secalis]